MIVKPNKLVVTTALTLLLVSLSLSVQTFARPAVDTPPLTDALAAEDAVSARLRASTGEPFATYTRPWLLLVRTASVTTAQTHWRFSLLPRRVL